MNKQFAILAMTLFFTFLSPPALLCDDWTKGWPALRQAFSTVHAIKTDFVQHKKLKILSRPLVSKGRFFFQAPDNLRWEYILPLKTILLLNKGDVNRYTWLNNEYSRESGAGLESMQFVMQDISNWLSGDFESSRTFVATIKPGSPAKIVLVPREESLAQFIQRVELTLSPTPGILKAVEIIESPQASTYIEFFNSQINLQFDKDLFTHVR